VGPWVSVMPYMLTQPHAGDAGFANRSSRAGCKRLATELSPVGERPRKGVRVWSSAAIDSVRGRPVGVWFSTVTCRADRKARGTACAYPALCCFRPRSRDGRRNSRAPYVFPIKTVHKIEARRMEQRPRYLKVRKLKGQAFLKQQLDHIAVFRSSRPWAAPSNLTYRSHRQDYPPSAARREIVFPPSPPKSGKIQHPYRHHPRAIRPRHALRR